MLKRLSFRKMKNLKEWRRNNNKVRLLFLR